MDDVFGASDDEVKLCYYRALCGCGFFIVASSPTPIGNVFHAETKETNQRRGGGGGGFTSC